MEKPLKVITSLSIIQMATRHLSRKGNNDLPEKLDYPDFLALMNKKIFLVSYKKKENTLLTELKKKEGECEIEHCSMERWVKIVEQEQIDKIFIDDGARAKIMIALQHLKKISFEETAPYLNNQEIKNIFQEKKNDQYSHILRQQIQCTFVNQKQIETFTQTNLIAQMAFVCCYHKIYQGACIKEVQEEIEHYVLSKCNLLSNVSMSCQAQNYDTTKDGGITINENPIITDHQIICLSIVGKVQGLRLQNFRIVSCGEILNLDFLHFYQENQKNYLFFQKAFSQQKKKITFIQEVIAEWGKNREKNIVTSGQMPLAQLSFSEKFDLDLLPSVLENLEKTEILSIFFPSPIKTFCLHAIVNVHEKTKRKNIATLSEDHLELLRFLR